MAYSIELKPKAQKAILRLAKPLQTRILDAIEELADNPRPPSVKKLQSSFDLYRIRVGDYRVVNTIHDGRLEILVIAIGRRRDIYHDPFNH